MAEINKINIKGVDYDIGGGGGSEIDAISITLNISQEDLNASSVVAQIVVGANISQEDYDKLKVIGNHIINILFKYTLDGEYTEEPISIMGVTMSNITVAGMTFDLFYKAEFAKYARFGQAQSGGSTLMQIGGISALFSSDFNSMLLNLYKVACPNA